MTTSPRSLASTLFPVGLLLIAMASIQSGASLAKSMFPIVGAQGTTTLRLVFASVIMLLLLRPWRAKLTAKSLRTVVIYGIALGGMNFLFYMSLRTVPLGIAVALEFTGPLAVAIYASRRAVDVGEWAKARAIRIGGDKGQLRGAVVRHHLDALLLSPGAEMWIQASAADHRGPHRRLCSVFDELKCATQCLRGAVQDGGGVKIATVQLSPGGQYQRV